MLVKLKQPPPVVYPDSDGKPMSDNTKQFRWIQILQGNLAAKFREDENVFVAGDLLWYPVEGEDEIRVAPDVLVAFGRPKGDRGSYKQWEEEDIAPQVVFEVLSPSNDAQEMADKSLFYDEYGVEEYYIYNPNRNDLSIYTRRTATLKRVYQIEEHISPRLQIRFDLSGEEMVVFHADGRRFLTFEELEAERAREKQRADKAEQLLSEVIQRADKSEQLLGEVIQRADQAEQRLDEVIQRADQAEQRLDEVAQRLTRIGDLTRKLLLGQANDEEKAELARLTVSPSA